MNREKPTRLLLWRKPQSLCRGFPCYGHSFDIEVGNEVITVTLEQMHRNQARIAIRAMSHVRIIRDDAKERQPKRNRS